MWKSYDIVDLAKHVIKQGWEEEGEKRNNNNNNYKMMMMMMMMMINLFTSGCSFAQTLLAKCVEGSRARNITVLPCWHLICLVSLSENLV